MAIKVRLKSTFPARVVESTGINITVSGGVYTFAWDISGIAEKTSITSAERDNIFLPAYDSDNSHYRLIDLDTLLTMISAGLDATLVAIAGLAPTANKAIYWTGADVAALYDISVGGRALSNTTAAADKLPYYTSATEAGTTDITSVARTLLAQSTQTLLRGTGLGLATTTTDNAVSRYHSTAGETQNSGVLIDDSNNITPGTSDGGALGTTALMWSDLFLATGGVINWNNGGITVTENTDSLVFAGATTYQFGAALIPSTDDGAALGSSGAKWSDLFLASGAVVNFNGGDVTITHAANALAFAGGTVSFDVAPTIGGGAVYYGGGTDVVIADGGTGASTAQGARSTLGVEFAQKFNTLCPHENLKHVCTAATSVTITADAVTLFDSNGAAKRFTTLSETPAITSSGANGLDTGAEAGSTWYHLWAIGKTDGTLDTLISTSSTAPTMPATYDYKGYIGAVYNDGSSNFVPYIQRGNSVGVIWQTHTALAAGTQTSYTSVSLAALVPSTATSFSCAFNLSTTSGTATVTAYISSHSAGTTDERYRQVASQGTTGNSENFPDVPIQTAQTTYYKVAGTNAALDIYVIGWVY